jgi:hypothetical protein
MFIYPLFFELLDCFPFSRPAPFPTLSPQPRGKGATPDSLGIWNMELGIEMLTIVLWQKPKLSWFSFFLPEPLSAKAVSPLRRGDF